ncbi:MAG: NBR1-Ig-like domain-containing protein [Anaerolineales bacterium]
MFQNKVSSNLPPSLKLIPFLWIIVSACSGISKPTSLGDQTLYIPPSPQIEKITQSPNPSVILPTPTITCTNSLRFVADITIPDGSQVKPNESIEKIWEVENNGSCNWDERYRLKWIGGSELGSAAEQALYPARSGTHAQIRLHLIAPQTPATYHSAWQAFDPQGVPFGDPIFIEFVVIAP